VMSVRRGESIVTPTGRAFERESGVDAVDGRVGVVGVATSTCGACDVADDGVGGVRGDGRLLLLADFNDIGLPLFGDALSVASICDLLELSLVGVDWRCRCMLTVGCETSGRDGWAGEAAATERQMSRHTKVRM